MKKLKTQIDSTSKSIRSIRISDAIFGEIKRRDDRVLTKSGLMLGLGETTEELDAVFADLQAIACDVVTLGQYLRPSEHHLPVERYVTPEEFDLYRQWGLTRGFLEVVAGPLVRSSYRADRVFQKNNVGL